jgi:hypothetical protein
MIDLKQKIKEEKMLKQQYNEECEKLKLKEIELNQQKHMINKKDALETKLQ